MNSFFKWVAIFSCVLGCGIIYSAMWNSYFGNYTQKMQWPLTHWVGSLTWIEQVVLFLATPFASALAGGILVGFIFVCIVGTIYDATLGKLFR